jgi:hypothetical protein
VASGVIGRCEADLPRLESPSRRVLEQKVVSNQSVRCDMNCPRVRLAVVLSVGLVACGGSANSHSAMDCPGFSRIVSGGFTRSDTLLTWTVEVESIPSTWTVNRAAVPNNLLEYAWQVNIDSNSDGLYDMAAAIMHFKTSSISEYASRDIIASTQHNLWRRSGTQMALIGSLDATLDGNVFTLSSSSDAAPELATLSSPEQCQWVTMYLYGSASDACKDTWP